MASLLAARLSKLNNNSSAVPAPVPVPAELPVASPVASPVATPDITTSQIPTVTGLNFIQLIELLDVVTKELKKQGKSAVKPAIKKAAKESAGQERKPRVLTPAAQIRSDFNMHVNQLLKDDPSLKDTKIPDPENPGSFKKVGFMTLASHLKNINSPIYLDFLSSKGVKPEDLTATAPKKPKLTDEEKAANKLAKLEAKKSKTSTKASTAKAAAEPVPAISADTDADAADAADQTIDFTVAGKQYTRLPTGHAWLVDGDDLIWAGVYNVITNKFDTSVMEPSA